MVEIQIYMLPLPNYKNPWPSPATRICIKSLLLPLEDPNIRAPYSILEYCCLRPGTPTSVRLTSFLGAVRLTSYVRSPNDGLVRSCVYMALLPG